MHVPFYVQYYPLTWGAEATLKGYRKSLVPFTVSVLR